MKSTFKALWRWLLTILLYVGVGFLLLHILNTQIEKSGISPAGYWLATWQENCRAMLFETFVVSFGLVCVWNLFSWLFLGGRKAGRGAVALNGALLLVHVLAGGFVLYRYIQYVIKSFFQMPTVPLYFMPLLVFSVLFFFVTRLLGPERVAHRFGFLNRVRQHIPGLRYV
ncbi:hypothetical protein FACS1894196_0710 [Clostridia bacterium]|nr:hypothetical protein FACS1894196_0660 [Clostridia bacterium]GHU82419.1 hypothetical protein FACS1894196_0710 [Clostridia bacterium]